MDVEKFILVLGESVKTALIVIAAVTVLFFTAFYYLHEPFRHIPLIIQLIFCLGIAIAYSIPVATFCSFAQYKNIYIYVPLIELSYTVSSLFVRAGFGCILNIYDFLVSLLVAAVLFPVFFLLFWKKDERKGKLPPVSGEQPV